MFSLLFRTGLALAVALAFTCAVQAQQARRITSLDAGWKFFLGDDQEARTPGFSDQGWRTLNVPHDWSIEGNYDQNHPTGGSGGYLPAGIGWYRRQLVLPENESGRRLFIEFDGVMANSDVWVNGQHLGRRPYGYSAFEYEITGKVTFGNSKPNVIAVRVDNQKQPASRWYTGAGIYRHVRLISVQPVHLEQWGVFITTPEVSAQRATVSVQSSVVNQSDKEAVLTVQTVLKDAEGKSFQTPAVSLKVAAGDTAQCTQTIPVSSPKLWDLEHPNLYQAQTTVRSGRTVLDDVVNTFGIREARFEAATGFHLNGKNIKILGVCLHHDGGPVGSAVPAAVWRRRFERLKDIGVNAVRASHNPMDPAFYDLCDQMGLLVMDESFDTWTAAKPGGAFGYNLYFNEWWAADTRAMVMRDRNHPSVIIYSAGNEIHDPLNTDVGRDRFLMQRDLMHRLDPTRPVTLALFRPNNMQLFNNGFAALMDVVGTNYRDAELIAAHEANPTWKILATENNHDTKSWLYMRDHPAHAGQFLWTGLEYLGEAMRWPNIGWSTALLDRNGFWRPLGYQRQSWWSPRPMVKMLRKEGNMGAGADVEDWSPVDQGTYDMARITVFSNCDEVELFLNGTSKGRLPINTDASPRVWNFEFEPGEIKAVAYNKGQQVAVDEMKTAGDPVKVVLAAERSSVQNTWEDVVYVTATIVDKDGVLQPNADRKLTFKVSGPGTLLAVDNGSTTSHESYKSNERTTSKGHAVALIQASANSGKITVSVSADGLEGSQVTLDVVPALGNAFPFSPIQSR